MFIASAERTDLGCLGIRTWTTEHQNTLSPPARDGCVLVWLSETQALIPDFIAVPDGELESFLAWTITYAPQLCPITALVRVVEYNVAIEEVGRRSNQAQAALSWNTRHLRGWLGVVNAEVVAAFQGSFAPFSVGVTPHLSTFSWLALQIQCLGIKHSLRNVYEAWIETRRLLDARPLNYVAEVEEVWSIIAIEDVGGGNSKRSRETKKIRQFLGAVAEGHSCENLLEVSQEQIDLLRALRTGPLEGRMEVFRRLLQVSYDRHDASATNAVFVGYALSQISQGSFAHIGLVGPGRVFDVRPLLWYGWFEFSRDNLEPNSSVIAAANVHLLKRVQELCGKPRDVDIALDELRILARLKEPFAECLLDIRHPITVEIISGAAALVQARSGVQYGQRKRPGQQLLFDDRDS